MADQAASSLSNILVAVIVARSFDSPEPFAAFGVAMVAYQLMLSGIRSVTGEPFLSLYSPAGPTQRRRLQADLCGTVLFISVLCSLVVLAVSAVIGGLSGSALQALAFVFPLVVLQDAWRYVFIIDRPYAALAIDLIWLVAAIVALHAMPAGARVGSFVLVWGLSGGLGGVIGIGLGWGLPLRLHPWRWLIDHWVISARYLGDFVTARAVSELAINALTAISGLAAFGAVRATQIFYGPINTLHGAVSLAVVPEGARSRDRPEHIRRLCVAVAIGTIALGIVATIAGVLLPDRIGEAAFGPTWDRAEGLLLPMGLAMIPGALVSAAVVGMQSLADSKRRLAAQLQAAPGQLICPLAGAFINGAVGFLIGLAVGRVISATLWTRMLRRALADANAAVEARNNGSGDLSVDQVALAAASVDRAVLA